MKRRLAFIACAILAQSAYAQTDLTTNAEYRLRFENNMDQDFNADANPSSENNFKQRVKLDTTYRSGEKLTAFVSLLHNTTWGNDAATTNSETGVFDGTADAQNMVLMNQAYLSWMATDELMFRAGRGAFTLADGAVVSTNDWQAIPYSFEGVLASYDTEFARFSAFGVKGSEYTAAADTVSDPESNFFGISVDVKGLPEWLKMANVHVMKVNKDREAGAATIDKGKMDQMRYGLTAAGSDSFGIDYRATYAAHTGTIALGGTEVDLPGSMIDAEIGYSLPDVMNMRFYATYHMDSGDDNLADTESKSYQPFFYERHKYAGLMDVMGFGNLTYLGGGLTVTPMDNLDVGVHYLMFSQTEAADSVNVDTNGSMLDGNDDTTEDALGSEIDLTVDHKYESGLAFRLRYSMFTPGDAFKANALEDTYSQIYFQAMATF